MSAKADGDRLADLARRVYELALAEPGWSSEQVAEHVGIGEDDVRRAWDWLAERQLFDPSRRRPIAAPERALVQLLNQQAGSLRHTMEELERSQRALTDVAALFLGIPVTSRDTVEMEVFENRESLRRRLDDFIPMNQRDALSMRPVLPDQDVLEVSLPSDLKLMARGVRFRLLVGSVAARKPSAASYLDAISEAGGEVRVANSLPLYLLILDGRLIVTPILDEDQPGDIVLHNRLLARCMTEVFDHSWNSAAPYGESEDSRVELAGSLNSTHRQVLRMLASGAKDEAIARQLGCSERTLRRLVAQLLDALGASSRFAAGARAAHLGLLD